MPTIPLMTTAWGPTPPVVDLACGQRRPFHHDGCPQCVQGRGVMRQCPSAHVGWTPGDRSSLWSPLFSGRKPVTWQRRWSPGRKFRRLDGVTWLLVDGHRATWQNGPVRRIHLWDVPRRADKDGRPTGAGSPSRSLRVRQWRRAAHGGDAMDKQKQEAGEEGEEEGGEPRKMTMEDESSLQRRFFARGAHSAEVKADPSQADPSQADPPPDGGRTTGQRALAGGGLKLAQPVVGAFTKPWQRAIVAVIGIGILWSVAWLRNLGAAGLVDDTEPLFAEAARQMVVTGDWITPQFNAQPRFDKPVLIYWLMAGSVKLFGDHVWAVRLPSAVCGAVTSLAIAATVFQFGLSYSPDQAWPSDKKNESDAHQLANSTFSVSFSVSSVPRGRIAYTVMAIVAFLTSIEVVIWGSLALSDMLLTSTMSMSLLSFFWGYVGSESAANHRHRQRRQDYRWGYPLCGIFAALAVLAKGPIGFVLPAAVIGVYLLYTAELIAVIREFPWVFSFASIAAINCPWYFTMAAKHGKMYLSTFFGYHNIERFTQGVNHHGGRPWWYGLSVVGVGFFPWCLWIPSAISREILSPRARAIWQGSDRSSRLPLFATIWFSCVYTFFSLSSSKLPSYYLPLAPTIAMLASSQLISKDKSNLSRSSTSNLLSICGVVLPALLYFAISGAMFALPSLLENSGDLPTAYIGRAIKEAGLHVCGSLIFATAAALLLLRSYFFLPPLGQLQARSQVLLQSWKHRLWQLLRKKTRDDRVMGSAADGVLSDNVDVNDMQQKPYSSVPPTWLIHALVMVAFLLLFFTRVYKAADSVRQRPLRELAISARTIQREGEPLIMVGTRMPSVVFYSRRPVAFFDKLEEAEAVLQHEAAPGTQSAVVIVEKSLWTPGTRATAYDELEQKGDYTLVRMLRAIENSVSQL